MFDKGEAFQFDWREEGMLVSGRRRWCREMSAFMRVDFKKYLQLLNFEHGPCIRVNSVHPYKRVEVPLHLHRSSWRELQSSLSESKGDFWPMID